MPFVIRLNLDIVTATGASGAAAAAIADCFGKWRAYFAHNI